MSNHLKKLTLLGIIGLLISSCVKDGPPLPKGETPAISSLKMTDDVAMSISYEMSTSTFLTTLNVEDKSEMTRAEAALSIPKPMGCRVTQMVKKNGQIDADIEMVQFENLPVFPKKMIGNLVLPKKFDTKRIKTRDGLSTHYNEDGEVITSEIQSESDRQFIEQIMTDIKESIPVSTEQMDIVIQAFKDSGFDIEQSGINPYIQRMVVEDNDGSRIEVFMDTNLQLIRGRNNYSPDGKLETSSFFIFDNTTGEMTGHWFSVYYISPFSGNEMVLNKVSKINNLVIKLNQ